MLRDSRYFMCEASILIKYATDKDKLRVTQKSNMTRINKHAVNGVLLLTP